MKIKNITMAVALGLAAWSAQAANVDNTIDLIGDSEIGWSAGLSDPSGTAVNHALSGSFIDSFVFHYSGTGIVDVWLDTASSVNALATQQIVFTGATLNGVALTIDPAWTSGGTVFRTAGLFQEPLSGDLTLVVSGYAGLMGSQGQRISASYSGGINVMPTSAVPEPESYALMLAGLSVVGLLARRRKIV